MKTIGILGCGWLGLPLGAHFVRAGWEVRGSTTRPERGEELRAAGIAPFVFKFAPAHAGDDPAALLASDVLIVDTPPSKAGDYAEQMRQIAAAVPPGAAPRVIFTSSTSVYPDLKREVVEADVTEPEHANHRAVAEAEAVWRASRFSTTVLRCAGLMGGRRIPGRYTAGRTLNRPGDAPVNLVHREDVIGVVCEVIQQAAWSEVFNVVAPLTARCAELYELNAARYGWEPTTFTGTMAGGWKRISGQKLYDQLGYTYAQPDPRMFVYP
ncbi:MAG: NAD(P)H-binding protein [Catalinimonas sp.]